MWLIEHDDLTPLALPPQAQRWRALAAAPDRAYLAGGSAPVPGWQRLHPLQALSGVCAGSAASHQHVVETDADADADSDSDSDSDSDFNACDADEHLPGLAAVPGTVSAARFRRDAAPGRPRDLAGHGLTGPDMRGSPAWLAVRHPPWSARVWPSFRNTRRLMFARADAPAR
jgi:hypothetical protein